LGNKIKYFRLFDVNVNRAREGLRVIEDTVRFVIPEKNNIKNKLFTRIKKIRHKLSGIIVTVYPGLITMRDTASDTGRIQKEKNRKSLQGIVISNFRRIQESFRVLEEYSKLVVPDAAIKFKALRFKVYEIEQKVYESLTNINYDHNRFSKKK